MAVPAFELIGFLEYLRRQWRVFAISSTVAVVLAFAAGLLLPERYTATTQVLIQPPGSMDPRAATAVSPVYLESLKAYENIASSSRVFARALDEVRPPEISLRRPIEVLKSRMLRISKPASTAVLQIQVTSTNPASAHALAQNIAQQMADISRSLDDQSGRELLGESRKQLNEAQTALSNVRAAEHKENTEPISALEGELDNASDLKGRLNTELALARADLAGYEGELRDGADGTDAGQLRKYQASTAARIAAFEAEQRDLTRAIAQDAARLEKLKNREDAFAADEKSAEEAYEAANSRLNQLLLSTALQGERLRVIDPGIVPQSPSSPSIWLDVLAALALATAASFIYVMIHFGFEHEREPELEYALRR